jgi:hypothetical protein
MRFYGMQPSEVDRLDENDRELLLDEIDRLQASEAWFFIRNVRAALDAKASKPLMESLAQRAFEDEELAHALISLEED